jgi:uncharacterized protein (TIGR03435 family)
VTLQGLIEFAYDIQDFQLSGGPGWLRTDRYEILAKPERPEGPDDVVQAPDAEQKSLWKKVRERTRALLAERFQLAVHSESEERQVYALVLAKNGHKLKMSTENRGITRNRGLISSEGGRSGCSRMSWVTLASVPTDGRERKYNQDGTD